MDAGIVLRLLSISSTFAKTWNWKKLQELHNSIESAWAIVFCVKKSELECSQNKRAKFISAGAFLGVQNIHLYAKPPPKHKRT